MSEITSKFVREGLARYAEACATLTLFQEELAKLLREVLEERESWGNMKLGPEGKSFKTGAKQSISSDHQWVEATALGRIGSDDVTMELGVWWNAPAAPSKLILFCGFYSGPESLTNFVYKPQTTRGYQAFTTSQTYVCKPITSDVDVKVEGAALLEEVLRESGVI